MSRPEFLPLPVVNRTTARSAGMSLHRPAGAGVAPLATGEPAPIPLPGGKGGKTEAEKIRAAAQQFEAVFISYLYKTMRATVPDSPFADGQSQSQGMYEDMFTQSLGTSLAGSGASGQGLGLTELLIRNLEPKAARAVAGHLAKLEGEAAAAAAAGQSTGAGSGASAASPAGAGAVRAAVRALHSANHGDDGPESAAGAVYAARAAAPPDRLSAEKARRPVQETPALADNVRDALDRAADATGVDRRLLRAVALVESGGNPRAQSSRGARGLMQLMDGTARDLGVKNVFDPIENALAGARYLKRQLLSHGGDERLALASYNAGPGNVRRHGGVPPFPETLQYIQRVLDIRQKLGGDNA